MGFSRIRKRLPYLALAAAVIALDRVTKSSISSGMALHDAKVVVDGFFNLVHTRNTGIAFSLFADSDPVVKTYLIPLFSAAAVALVGYLFWSAGPLNWRSLTSLTLILAGAAGNLHDRLLYGYVTDFLDFYIGSYHWPAFNVADSAITTGAALLLLESFGASRAETDSNPA